MKYILGILLCLFLSGANCQNMNQGQEKPTYSDKEAQKRAEKERRRKEKEKKKREKQGKKGKKDKKNRDPNNQGRTKRDRSRPAPKAVNSFTENYLPAFPGAEGFGAKSKGGRGGRVIYVTNLNDSGPGSLRAAIEAKGPRMVLFKVSGTIQLKSHLILTNPYITIAGQTAPGDGICLRDYTFFIYGPSNDIIIRGIRSRHGGTSNDIGDMSDAIALNAFSPKKAISDVIIDHCSLSWSIDETFQVWDYSKNVTLQWCMVTEGLDNAGHPDGGPHSYAVLVMSGFDGGGISLHHNLIAHHRSRNPKFAGNQWDATATTYHDFRNNVVYNFGTRPGISGKQTDTKIRVNFVGNYYKHGPSTSNAQKYNLLLIQHKGDARYYLKDNFVYGNPARSANNWQAINYWRTENSENTIRMDAPIPCPPVTTQSAETAYELVLENAGCIAPRRDSVDERIVREVRNGTGRIIDSEREVGGWPILRSAAAPQDSDNDGMPDEWERARGLNPNNPADGNGDDDRDGYTNIEEYINSLIPMPY